MPRIAEKTRSRRTKGPKQEKLIDNPSLLIVDLFCGAGGTTTGFALSGIAKVIACINHDHTAIISHWQNHPEVRHFEEDMRTLALDKLIELVERARERYPNAKLVLWASLECTNFSKAKGGMARDADSRTLADHLHRYIDAINPDYVQIENVVEFRDWGPIRIKCKHLHEDRCDLTIIKQKKYEVVPILKRGKVYADRCDFTIKKKKIATKIDVYGWVPVPETKGQDFKRWCITMQAHGYKMDWKELDSADFGAFTSRNRLFGIFARPELNIVWPEQTHMKREKLAKLKKGIKTKSKPNPYKIPVPDRKFKPWQAVKWVLDFEDEGYSIFDRKNNMSIPARQRKDLKEPTFERVYQGCIKHIAGGKKKFMVRYHGGNPESRISDINNPLGVIDTQNRHAIVNTSFISKYFSGAPYNKNISIDGPAGTIRTADGQALITAKCTDAFLASYHGTGHNTYSVDNPGPVIPTGDGTALYKFDFLDKQYSGSANHQSVEVPAGAVLSNDKFAKVHPIFIDRQFSSGGGKDSSIDDPTGSILSVPKMNLVQAGFLDTTNYTNTPSSLEDLGKVITANRKWPYLFKMDYGGQQYSVENPSPVIIAKQDKMPIYLCITEHGELAIQIFETDSPCVRKLKEFMAMYGIVDIKMRMLKVPELLKIQGFPARYRLSGTQADQKKFIGNSVVPDVVKAWAMALHEDLEEQYLQAA